MSVVIALKFKNGVIFGSDRQATFGWNKVENTISKVRKLKDREIAIGGVGVLRDLQKMFTVQDSLLQETRYLTESSCMKAIDNLGLEYRKHGYIGAQDIIDEVEASFIMADAYNINCVSQDLAIMSGFDYYAIGCGQDLVMGYLNVRLQNVDVSTLDIKTATEILLSAVKTACKDSIGIDGNVDIITLYKNPIDIQPDEGLVISYKCMHDVMDTPKKKSICSKRKCVNCERYIKFVYWKDTDELTFISR